MLCIELQQAVPVSARKSLPMLPAIFKRRVDLLRGFPLSFDSDNLQAPRFHVDLDEVALLHKGNGSSCSRFGTHMPDDRSA